MVIIINMFSASELVKKIVFLRKTLSFGIEENTSSIITIIIFISKWPSNNCDFYKNPLPRIASTVVSCTENRSHDIVSNNGLD